MVLHGLLGDVLVVRRDRLEDGAVCPRRGAGRAARRDRRGALLAQPRDQRGMQGVDQRALDDPGVA
jgi:hypothetical protein